MQAAQAISSHSQVILVRDGSSQAIKNQEQIALHAPFIVKQNTPYLSFRDYPMLLDMKMTIKNESARYILETKENQLVIDLQAQMYRLNGQPFPLSSLVWMNEKRLYVNLIKISQMFSFEVEQRTLDSQWVIHFVQENEISEIAESDLPIAKFFTNKSSYRLGEMIEYVDVSYSPSGQTLVERQWEGRRDAFFDPGKKIIKLRVIDKQKRVSEVYRVMIEVVNEQQMTPFQYFLHHAYSGEVFGFNNEANLPFLKHLPSLKRNVTEDTSTTLMVSDSPESIEKAGILYQDRGTGRVRIYTNHKNKMSESLTLMILASNDSSRDIKLDLAKKGESFPSAYANLNGFQATLEFMIDGQRATQLLVPAKRTIVLAKLPTIAPNQGVNTIYEVVANENDSFRYTVVAVPTHIAKTVNIPSELLTYPQLPYNGHIRGTFHEANRTVFVNEVPDSNVSRMIIGDDQQDQFIRGYDPTRKMEVVNTGNYGVMYKILIGKIEQPTALMLRARGGHFKGHFRINGHHIIAPSSGVLSPQDGLLMITSLSATNAETVIQFSPPASTSFPIDLVFWPLNDKIRLNNETTQ